jgi:hypothetical protein
MILAAREARWYRAIQLFMIAKAKTEWVSVISVAEEADAVL